ncbi:MAG: hypothetical protein DME80_13590 [Verrucomicrobia bacterium]|nr:MAG: hypothetical protein DMC60_00745 [Verrucomicrobiota bacterium]PYJ28935.1 MAG: hypothetical protein DME89_05085 [Verrucomicrobiota bacterium]PYJ41554.1 MAG: hypothetical protein DME80_13590 [Verrucomicrobiota bacterium]
MADTESLRNIAHSRAPLSTWLGVVLLFALFGVIVLAIIGPMPRGSDYEETRAKKRMENLKTAQEDAEKALNTYAWVDKNKGVVRIPISRAMELTVADLAQKKPVAAGPIATPPPAQASPAGAGSAAASPAPAVSKPGGTQAAGSPSASVPSGSASPPSQTAGSPSAAAQSSPPAAASASPATSP